MAPGGAANTACMCSCSLAVSTDRVFSFFLAIDAGLVGSLSVHLPRERRVK